MDVKQVYEFVNEAQKTALGEKAVELNEDCSNLADVGSAIFDNSKVDNYCKALINRIGKVMIANDKEYNGILPSLKRDSWEYGSALQRISVDLVDAEETESWELTDGSTYDQDIFNGFDVDAKYYNHKMTFTIARSFTELQLKESFTSAIEMGGFIASLFNVIKQSLTIKIDELIMRGVDIFVAETVFDDFGSDSITSKSGVKAVNLLYMYNTKFGTSITADEAMTDADFLRFASMTIGLYMTRIKRMSKLFNIDGKARFTTADYTELILLDVFAKGADSYLQSEVFHNEYTKLPNADIIPYWQGSGTSYDFDDVSKISIKTPNNHEVTVTGVIGLLMDKDAVMVANQDLRVKTHENASAEFTNYFYHQDVSLLVATDCNGIVFFVA